MRYNLVNHKNLCYGRDQFELLDTLYDEKEAISEKTNKLTEDAGKLAERAYAEQQNSKNDESNANSDTSGNDNASDNDAVDAEFEEVKDEKN